jgi:hypothetical protein
MVSVTASEFVLVAAAVVIGLVLFGFTQALITPQYTFTLDEQQARTLASASFISVSPPDIGFNGYYSFVVYPYIPGFNGNITVFMFEEPQALLPSVAVLTPQSSYTSFSASFPNGTSISTVSIGPVYDTNGHELIQSLTGYTLPANYPFVINGYIPKGEILIIWVIYNAGNYYFRIAYTYTTG